MHGAKIFCDLFMVEHIYTIKKTLITCLKNGNLSSDGNSIELKLYRYLEVYRKKIFPINLLWGFLQSMW